MVLSDPLVRSVHQDLLSLVVRLVPLVRSDLSDLSDPLVRSVQLDPLAQWDL